jgi:predicted ester cyclase
MLQDAFADVAFTIEEIRSEGDRVVCRFVATGKQVAEFRGIKPGERQVRISGTTTFRVEGNRVKEGWGVLSF